MDGTGPDDSSNLFHKLGMEFDALKRLVDDLKRTVATLATAPSTVTEKHAPPEPSKPARVRTTVPAALHAETREKLAALASVEPVVTGTTPELLKRLSMSNLDAAQLARVLRRLNKDGEKSGLIVKNLGNRVVPEAGTYAQWAVLASVPPEARKRGRGTKGPLA